MIRDEMKPTVGVVLLVGSILLVVGSFGAGAVLAGPPDAGNQTHELLVGLQGPGADGKIELYDENRSLAWYRTDADSYHDVTPMGDHRVLATYIAGSEDCGQYDSPCGRTGFRVFNRTSGTLVRDWTYPVRNGLNSEVHDAEPLGDGRFLVAGMDRERLFVVDGDGEITWQWNASEFYEAPPDTTKRDWLHINDVDVIEDGRYLISVRNSNQLLVVEREEGVVDVINEDDNLSDGNCLRDDKQLYDADGDGDVRCGDPDVINHQHNPQWLGDGAVVVADSENQRVVELHENDDGEWEIVWSVALAGGEEFAWPRDSDRLSNGLTLITDSRNNRVVAVNESGDMVWQKRTSALPYEADVLSTGEPTSGPLYNATGTGALDRDGSLPLFGQALVGLQHVYPVPYWVTDWHMVAVFVGLLSFCVGVGLLVSAGTVQQYVREAR